MTKESDPWVMPDWMEPYRGFIGNTGGDSIENLMNDRSVNFFNNAIRAALCISVDSQVRLLYALHTRGLLVVTGEVG